jgi:phosphotransferase family enzyme
MPEPPNAGRLLWLQPEWVAEAKRWIAAELERFGLEPAGEIEQGHVRWWSTVMRVPTTGGDVYFKANAPPHRFEAALVAMLVRLRPDQVPELPAVDPLRGWMLMRGGGTRLRELVQSTADLAHWEEVLPRYGELQLALASHADELLAVDVPDLRLAGFPASYRRLLEDDEAVLLDRTGGLTSDERVRLLDLAPKIAAAVRELVDYGIPETIQHDDFHDGNVFVRDGRYVFFDWGDSCVSHPFHTLVVTFRAIAHRFELDVKPGGPELLRLRDAYLEPFAGYGTHDELVAAVDLAHLTGTVGRALAWHRFVSAREPEFRADDAEAVPYGLKRLLDLGPLGSWS